MADPDAIRYLRIAQADLAEAQRMVELSRFRDSSIGFLLALMDWLEEAGSDLSPFERIADLTFFAVQTRYDDSLEITPPEWSLLLGVTSLLLTEAQRQLS